ncbi:serine/threonine-protein kinase [Paludisphaera rhizosphaerae]|uniref:serine/threonine-protein kinase n=1 Tax=Paludisphaera rhizosphaerae TaxID=2711216 RepID=UPI0013EAE0D0|nr:serine/threonine-protein kinase [Paludisphaera rhizosphaerae]
MMIAAKDPASWGVSPSPQTGIEVEPSLHSHATHLLMSRLLDEPAGLVSESPVVGLSPTPTPTSSAPQPAMRLRPFQRIGEYRLIARLGRGAQGEVWKAVRGAGRHRVVALKILNPGLSIHHRRLAQFRREAERGARLVGPSLLQVVDAGEADGFFFMAMPFIEAVTLHDVIRERRIRRQGDPVEPLHPIVDLDDARYYVEAARTIARSSRALDRIHVHRIVHRDVKPANILLERRSPFGVFLCDLGLGRDLDQATREQMRDGAGTPMYMAPERLRKDPADEILSDVYSMGATLFEALTLGRQFEPIRDVPLPALAPMLAKASPRTPRAVDPNLPACFEPVILRAVAPEPQDRYQSAGALADALDNAAAEAHRRLNTGVNCHRPRHLDPRRRSADVRAEMR